MFGEPTLTRASGRGVLAGLGIVVPEEVPGSARSVLVHPAIAASHVNMATVARLVIRVFTSQAGPDATGARAIAILLNWEWGGGDGEVGVA